jgi:hypothetical protein
MKPWRIVSRLGLEIGVFIGKDESDALDLAYRSGKVKRGQKGIRVLPHIVGHGPIVTLSAAVLRVTEPAPHRPHPGFRRTAESIDLARVLIVAAEPELEKDIMDPMAVALVPWGRVEHGPGLTDHGRADEAAVLKLSNGQHERLRVYVVAGTRALREGIEADVMPVARFWVEAWNRRVAEAGRKEIERLSRAGKPWEELQDAALDVEVLSRSPHLERGRAEVGW